jgi:glycosyltransferase involved in cell wall biosynthesis
MGFEESFVVMHAGNMGLSQNLEMLPQVASALTDESDVRLVLLGDGPAKPLLKAEVERRRLDNVEFLEALAPDDAQSVMSAADVHVVSLVPGLWGCATPSKTYGIMAAGRPFVAAVDDGAEPALLIEELDCGMHVPPNDPDALARAIRELRTSPLDEMGARARQGYEQRFTANKCLPQLTSMLVEVSESDG